MNAKERLYVWLNNGTFVEKDGCTHPQDIIAAAIGCSERTVIRSVQQLEAEGRLRVHRPRRRGACNTYWVSCWNPAKRSGVLNVLGAVRPAVLKRRFERDQRSCQIKENGKASKGATPPVNPFLTEAVENKRCGRESAKNLRRSHCMEARHRHLHPVHSTVCLQCAPVIQEKDQEIERLHEINRKLIARGPDPDMKAKLEQAHEHILGVTETMNAQGKELARFRRMETEINESTPHARLAREVLDFWAETHPKANVTAQGARAKLVRSAIRLGHTKPMIPCPVHDEDGNRRPKKDIPEDARCTIADELKEAVEYLRLKPFVGPRGRTGTLEPGCKDYSDLKYALADEKGTASEAKIEKCRREVHALRSMPVERLWTAYKLARDAADTWHELAAVEHDRRLNPVLPEVDGIPTEVEK